MTLGKKNFGAAVLEIITAPLSVLPLRFHLFCGRLFAALMRDVLKYRRDDVMINLARSFPEKKYRELIKISRQFYRHFGEILAEAIWFGGCRGERGRRRLNRSNIVDVANPEVFNDFYEKSGNLLVLSSHCGNWELLGGWFAYNHREDAPFRSDYSEIAVVYKQLRSPVWDRFMADNRCAPIGLESFEGYLESRQVLRYALENRDKKHIYIFPTDQYPYGIAKKHSIGKFMNQETLAMTGGTALACKLGMSVAYLRWIKLDGGRYSVEFVPICENASLETPEGLMRRYYDLLEEDLRRQPYNYLWTHRRWK